MTVRDPRYPANQVGQPANSSDFVPVCICFQDGVINYLFAELLEVRGVETRIIENIMDLAENARVVTEPQYFPLLGEKSKERCLVVGNKDALEGITAVALSRPLTEEKIERAIQEFLKT